MTLVQFIHTAFVLSCVETFSGTLILNAHHSGFGMPW